MIFRISLLTFLFLINLDTMVTPKPVTTDEQTTEQLKEVIEQHKPDEFWIYEFNDYEENGLDII